MITRIALLGFDESVDRSRVAEFTRKVYEMAHEIDGIQDLEFGPKVENAAGAMDVNVRTDDSTYTHGLRVSFDDLASYRSYVDHPFHASVSKYAFDHLGRRAVVLDFEPDVSGRSK